MGKMARCAGGWVRIPHCSRSKSLSEGKLRRVEKERERERVCVCMRAYACVYTIDRTRAVNLVIKDPFCYRFNRIMLSRTDRKFGGMATHTSVSVLLKFHAACVGVASLPPLPPLPLPLLPAGRVPTADHPTYAIHHPPPIGRRKPFLRAVTIWRRAKFISASAVGISRTRSSRSWRDRTHCLGAFTGLNHKIVPERRRNSTDLREWAALVRWRVHWPPVSVAFPSAADQLAGWLVRCLRSAYRSRTDHAWSPIRARPCEKIQSPRFPRGSRAR